MKKRRGVECTGGGECSNRIGVLGVHCCARCGFSALPNIAPVGQTSSIQSGFLKRSTSHLGVYGICAVMRAADGDKRAKQEGGTAAALQRQHDPRRMSVHMYICMAVPLCKVLPRESPIVRRQR